jgi:hypothetical protein
MLQNATHQLCCLSIIHNTVAEDNVPIEEDHDFDDLPVASSSVASKRAADRQLAREVRELRDKKLSRLADLKKDAEDKLAATSADKISSRLEYLMRVSAEYTNIASTQHKESAAGSASSATAAVVAPAPGKRGHHRLSEKEEDEVRQLGQIVPRLHSQHLRVLAGISSQCSRKSTFDCPLEQAAVSDYRRAYAGISIRRIKLDDKPARQRY